MPIDWSRKKNQDMTLYRTTGYNPDGSPQYAAPELRRVRFSATNELSYTNSGEELYQKALIITEEQFTEGDQGVMGNKIDILDPVEAGASEIKRVTMVPSITADDTMYIYHI